VLGEEHVNTLNAMNNLAGAYLEQKKFAQAEPLFVRVLEGRRRIRGEEHPDTLNAMENLGRTYLDQGEFAQAEPLFVKGARNWPTCLRGYAPPDAHYRAKPGQFVRVDGESQALGPPFSRTC